MVNKTADYFEDIAKQLGLSIKIPRPSKATRGICGVTNGAIGVALIGAGAVFKKPSLIALSALGVAGAVALSLEK